MGLGEHDFFSFLDREITRRVDRPPLILTGNTETSQVCMAC